MTPGLTLPLNIRSDSSVIELQFFQVENKMLITVYMQILLFHYCIQVAAVATYVKLGAVINYV